MTVGVDYLDTWRRRMLVLSQTPWKDEREGFTFCVTLARFYLVLLWREMDAQQSMTTGSQFHESLPLDDCCRSSRHREFRWNWIPFQVRTNQVDLFANSWLIFVKGKNISHSEEMPSNLNGVHHFFFWGGPLLIYWSLYYASQTADGWSIKTSATKAKSRKPRKSMAHIWRK